MPYKNVEDRRAYARRTRAARWARERAAIQADPRRRAAYLQKKRDYHERNLERDRARMRKYYAQNRARFNQSSRLYYRENRARLRVAHLSWLAAHPEWQNNYYRAYRAKNRERVNAWALAGAKRAIREMRPRYLKRLLIRSGSASVVPESLIKVKRHHLKMLRAMKEIEHERHV